MTTTHTFISTSYTEQYTITIKEKNIYLFIYLFILLVSFRIFLSCFLSGNRGVSFV